MLQLITVKCWLQPLMDGLMLVEPASSRGAVNRRVNSRVITPKYFSEKKKKKKCETNPVKINVLVMVGNVSGFRLFDMLSASYDTNHVTRCAETTSGFNSQQRRKPQNIICLFHHIITFIKKKISWLIKLEAGSFSHLSVGFKFQIVWHIKTGPYRFFKQNFDFND